MEKFSQFRDSGTGIQPFLNPVPPVDTSIVPKITLPIRYALGILKFSAIVAIVAIYTALVHVIGPVVLPIDALFYPFRHLVTWICGYPMLWLAGVYHIPSEQTPRRKGKGNRGAESWSPKAGDVIVSNWVSWVELVWLAIRFNPVFVLPICEPVARPSSSQSSSSNPITHTPGRRTGTGSANVQTSTTRAPTKQSAILGYREFSLLSMIRLTGRVAPFVQNVGASRPPESFETIRKRAKRPVVVLPEGTTSNGRGLLRFSNAFGRGVPVMDFRVYIMCVRYDPPTTLAPSASQPIYSGIFNPLPQIFHLASSFSVSPITIRLLPPPESPSSGSFLASDFLSDYRGSDELAESCAALMSQVGKLKRVGMGWEDKAVFLDFYHERSAPK